MIRYIIISLHVISLILLGLGWIKDMLHIDISAHFIVELKLFNEKRSVIGTLQTLWESGNYWPFLLIFLFGIVVPLVKSLIIFYLLIVNNSQKVWFDFINTISKWAMADVFAISIFIAFLGANAMENTKAYLESGFYYFSGYVLLSGFVVYLLGKYLTNHKGSIT